MIPLLVCHQLRFLLLLAHVENALKSGRAQEADLAALNNSGSHQSREHDMASVAPMPCYLHEKTCINNLRAYRCSRLAKG